MTIITASFGSGLVLHCGFKGAEVGVRNDDKNDAQDARSGAQDATSDGTRGASG